MIFDRVAREERGALARASLDGLHGCLDSSEDALLSCQPCRWCHAPASAAGAVLKNEAADGALHEPTAPGVGPGCPTKTRRSHSSPTSVDDDSA